MQAGMDHKSRRGELKAVFFSERVFVRQVTSTGQELKAQELPSVGNGGSVGTTGR